MLGLHLLVLALAGKCCCDQEEIELPTRCEYLSNRNNCGKNFPDHPHKVLVNGRSTKAKDCEALVKGNQEELAVREDRFIRGHARAIRESQPAFLDDMALEAAKMNRDSNYRGVPEVTAFYNQLEKMGYKKADILAALRTNGYTSVKGCVRVLESWGIEPEAQAQAPRRDTVRAEDSPARPPRRALEFEPTPLAAPTEDEAVDPVTGLPALGPEWEKVVNAGGKDYWQYKGSQTWTYYKPVVMYDGWICIVQPAADDGEETPYYWNTATGATAWEAPEDARFGGMTSFGPDCPKLKAGAPEAAYEEYVHDAYANNIYAEIDEVRHQAKAVRSPKAPLLDELAARTTHGLVETREDAPSRAETRGVAEEPRVARRHVPVGARGY